eukprot:TRINITY_DN20613_c0_g1_i1.p1 TRINITY_DN20613_c0_g1~~TRINITY_DN20613_c0_g1_i1.p1  ORF type:complete len:183 (-),score=10.20 TRINITY_DN20613_c0_g1_i1:175-723(-)
MEQSETRRRLGRSSLLHSADENREDVDHPPQRKISLSSSSVKPILSQPFGNSVDTSDVSPKALKPAVTHHPIVNTVSAPPLRTPSASSLRKSGNSGKVLYSKEEIAKHNKPDDCWIILQGKVYDVTSFFPRHPGGTRSLMNFAGKDASANIEFHSSLMMKQAREFYIGDLEGYKAPSRCIIS